MTFTESISSILSNNRLMNIKNLVLLGLPISLFLLFSLELFVSILGENGKTLGTPVQKWVDQKLFCEEMRLGTTILQPINSWSAFVYNLVGLVAIHISPDPKAYVHNFVYTHASVRYLYYFVFVFMGVGSFYFHASFTFWGSIADFSSIASLFSFLAAYSIARWFRKGAPFFFSVFGLLFVASVILRIVFDLVFDVDITLQWTLVFIFGTFGGETIRQMVFRRQGAKILGEEDTANLISDVETATTNNDGADGFYIEDWRWILFAFISLILAVIAWALDFYKIICFPQQSFQLHSVWHALTCYAGLYFYFYISLYNVSKVNVA
ncbi:hypothetical protein HK096_008266 [Nowakowskiella sp. JEL0078]|nr:hypothetical protein HK096_008266 [Nowakowskiella sp. JEL0078]